MEKCAINFTILLLFVALSSLANSQYCSKQSEKVSIVCSSFKNVPFPDLESVLLCVGDKFITVAFPDASVSSVVHSNNSQVTNAVEVEALVIHGAKVKFIPSGIKSNFPNLKALAISSCGLMSVNKDNFKEFGSSLEVLVLGYNKLTLIDADLFDYNPNLKIIELNYNPIRHIESEFFTNLKSLKSLKEISLESANCISQRFGTSKDQIATFEWESKNCTDFAAKLGTEYLLGKNFDCVDAKIISLKNEFSEIRAEMENIKVQMLQMSEDNKKMSESLKNIEDAVKK